MGRLACSLAAFFIIVISQNTVPAVAHGVDQGGLLPRRLNATKKAKSPKTSNEKRSPPGQGSIKREQQQEWEESPPAEEVMNNFVRVVAWFVAFLPWVALFFCAWNYSVVPGPFFESLFGAKASPPSLDGGLKFLVLNGYLAMYMAVLAWLWLLPPRVRWDTIPTFCVQPRSIYGLINLHHAPFHHVSLRYYSFNIFALWITGPLVLVHGKRTFVFSLFFISFAGHFLFWCIGSEDTCIAGFGPIAYGWLAVLLAGALLSKPIRPWHIMCVLGAGACLIGNFVEIVVSQHKQSAGETWLMHVCGGSCGLVFAILHFGMARCCDHAGFGTFEDFEKRSREAGSPWPGCCVFFLRFMWLLVCCCRHPKGQLADAGVEMIRF